MLRDCIAKCHDDLWSLAPNGHPRTAWRIAYHALFYTDFYLAPDSESFTPWSRHQNQAIILWDDDEEGMPPEETTYSQADLLAYLDELHAGIDQKLAALDLGAPASGFAWYPIPKLDHVLVALRHLGVHVGQLQELLYARGIDPDWKSIA